MEWQREAIVGELIFLAPGWKHHQPSPGLNLPLARFHIKSQQTDRRLPWAEPSEAPGIRSPSLGLHTCLSLRSNNSLCSAALTDSWMVTCPLLPLCLRKVAAGVGVRRGCGTLTVKMKLTGIHRQNTFLGMGQLTPNCLCPE